MFWGAFSEQWCFLKCMPIDRHTHSASCLSCACSPLPDVWLQVIGSTQVLGITHGCPGRNDASERQEAMHRQQHPTEQSNPAHSWDSCRASLNLQLRAHPVGALLLWWDTGPLFSEVKPLPVPSSSKARQESWEVAGRQNGYYVMWVIFFPKLIMISASLLSVTAEQV